MRFEKGTVYNKVKEGNYGWGLDHKGAGDTDRAITLGMIALEVAS